VIARVEALNYRCLRYVAQEVDAFQVLVGPNASGKSTFLDTVNLVGDLLREGVEGAAARSPDIRDLVWMRQGDRFEIALEFNIPPEQQSRLRENAFRRARYEVAIGMSADAAKELRILGENLWLTPETKPQPREALLFPSSPRPPLTLLHGEGKHAPPDWRKVVTKKADSGNDYFMAETTRWNNPFRLGPHKLALANLPEDEERFPVAIWVKRCLMEGVKRLMLNSEAMRRPVRPGLPLDFQPDGSNLPRIVERLAKDPERFQDWIGHLQTALPDLRRIDTVERPEDLHKYVRIEYSTGLLAPSWVISDGTLRLLAVTLLAYLRGKQQTYLIEEPENGIHPLAVETVFQSLSSSYDAQILCATHSPVVLSRAEPRQLLCFAKTEDGATDIRRGDEHPTLSNWQRDADLGTLFAAGVLG